MALSRSEIEAMRAKFAAMTAYERFAYRATLRGDPEAYRNWNYCFFPIDRHLAMDRDANALGRLSRDEQRRVLIDNMRTAESLLNELHGLKLELSLANDNEVQGPTRA